MGKRGPKPGTVIPPNAGKGRPKGSRNKLAESFLSALHADFLANGEETIERARVEDPVQYLKVIAGILPKELHITDVSELSEDEVNTRLREIAGLLGSADGLEERGAGAAGSAGSVRTPEQGPKLTH